MKMIVNLLSVQVVGLGPRLLAWAAGEIGEEEVMEDIKQYSNMVTEIKATQLV